MRQHFEEILIVTVGLLIPQVPEENFSKGAVKSPYFNSALKLHYFLLGDLQKKFGPLFDSSLTNAQCSDVRKIHSLLCMFLHLS